MCAQKRETARTVRTTVTLPAELVERGRRFIDQGLFPSRNALVVAALEAYLTDLEDNETERQFAAMAFDRAYRQFNQQTSRAFGRGEPGPVEPDDAEAAPAP